MDPTGPAKGPTLSRRHFLGMASLAAGSAVGLPTWILGEARPVCALARPGRWSRTPSSRAGGAAQRARPDRRSGQADIGGGLHAPGWLINQSLPSPLIRVRRGDPFNVRMENRIPDPLILHWHGLTPPEAADGHPHLAVKPGLDYDYDFRVENRAGTYWYHSHTHREVAKHTQAGIAGMLIVEDDDEDRWGCPRGSARSPSCSRTGNSTPPACPSTRIRIYGGLSRHGAVRERRASPLPRGGRRALPLPAVNGSNARIFRLGAERRAPADLDRNRRRAARGSRAGRLPRHGAGGTRRPADRLERRRGRARSCSAHAPSRSRA